MWQFIKFKGFMAMEGMVVLSTLCHSCRFACQQRVLKTFPGHGYLHSKDGVVWLWHFLVNLHIYDSPLYLATAHSIVLWAIGRNGGWPLYVIIVSLLVSKGCQKRFLALAISPPKGDIFTNDGLSEVATGS